MKELKKQETFIGDSKKKNFTKRTKKLAPYRGISESSHSEIPSSSEFPGITKEELKAKQEELAENMDQ